LAAKARLARIVGVFQHDKHEAACKNMSPCEQR